jgi:malate dehydrogenase
VIGADGIEEVLEIKLNDDEKANLKTSTDAVEELLVACKNLDGDLA